ncbi:hypothetical protein ACTFIR_000004 [Dictyostelium discoideum]
MKVLYIYIYILLLVCKFLFVKPSCSLIDGKIECRNEIETFELYNGTVVNVKMDTIEGKYYFNALKFPYKNLLCDLNYITKFTPEITSFPNIPTTGGEFEFTFNFPCDYRRKARRIFTEINILNTTFGIGAIPNAPILDDDKGILTIQGSNLYNTSIKIYSTNFVKDTNPIGALDASHSSVIFSVEEFLTPNNWTIEVSICGSFYKSYSYPYLPVLTKMVGVLNNKGGSVVFIGNHLRPKYNVTVFTTLRCLKSYGSLGYDIPITITVDGEYKSNPIKISYIDPR